MRRILFDIIAILTGWCPDGIIPAMITMYGIPNCDTIKKARKWLDDHGVAYAFHDYRKDGVDEGRLRIWVSEHGWETLLNRAGTTFRKLPDHQKQDIDEEKAITLMLANPSMIKRPVLDLGARRLVGFKAENYSTLFAERKG